MALIALPVCLIFFMEGRGPFPAAMGADRKIKNEVKALFIARAGVDIIKMLAT